jgi:hypothetical protein
MARGQADGLRTSGLIPIYRNVKPSFALLQYTEGT